MFKAKVINKGDARSDVRKLVGRIKGAGSAYVGLPQSAGAGLIERATFNEFGTKNIPERPFLRSTVADKENDWKQQLKRDARRVVQGRMTKRQALNKIGLIAVRDIVHTINSDIPPPNAPSTIAQKGSAHTLIDTGEMRNAISFEIEE